HDFGEEREVDIAPAECEIEQALRAVPLPDDVDGYRRKTASDGESVDAHAIAEAAAAAGIEALSGAKGPARDSIAYGGALALWHTGRAESLLSAAGSIRAALDSGEARRRFEA
ncbi:MAG: anthranilate phosphoribosyltransferase, partial [Gammaproteobacteria bacterium]